MAEEFKGFRGPGGIPPQQDLPEPEVSDEPEYGEDFINFFKETVFDGSREQKKIQDDRAKKQERKPASASKPSVSKFMSAYEPTVKIKTEDEISQENVESKGVDWEDARQFWNGFKGSFKDVGITFQQFYAKIKDDPELYEETKKAAAEVKASYGGSTAGTIGYMLGSVLPALIPIPGAQAGLAVNAARLAPTLLKAAGTSAALGALSTPVETGTLEDFGKEKLVQAGVSGALGGTFGAVGKGLASIGAKSGKKVGDKTIQAIAKEADEVGIRLRAGDVTDNQAIKALDEALMTNPASSQLYADIGSENKDVFLKSIVNAIKPGAKETAPTGEFLKVAAKETSDQFDKIKSLKDIPLDEKLKGQLKSVLKAEEKLTLKTPEVSDKAQSFLKKYQTEKTLPADKGYLKEAEKIRNFAKNIGNKKQKDSFLKTAQEFEDLGQARKVIVESDIAKTSGSDLVTSAKRLRSLAKNQDDAEAGKILRDMANNFEDAAERGTSEDIRKTMQEARKQWARIEKVKKLVVPSTGEVSEKKMATALNKDWMDFGDKTLFPETKKIADLSSKTFEPLFEGKSPTVNKALNQQLLNLLLQPATGIAAGAGIGALEGDAVKGGILGGAGSLVLKRQAAKLLTNKDFVKFLIEGSPKAEAVGKKILEKSGILGSQIPRTYQRGE